MEAAELPPHLRVGRQAFDLQMRNFVLARWIRTVLHDVSRVPSGPVLLVGNHGPLALDTGLLIHAMYRDTGHIVRALGDKLVFANPLGRTLARSVAGVEANPENARALLAAREWVLVYPGGARETLRDPGHRYQLNWEGRLGFARIALEAQVPIVPVACIGSDDLFVQVLDRDTVRSSWLGRMAGAFIDPDYIPPLFLPRLRATQFHYFFGEPIAPSPETGDEHAISEHQQRVKAALEQLVDHGREVRRERMQGKAETEREASHGFAREQSND